MLKTLQSKEFTYGGFIFRKTCAPRIILREVCELKVKFRNISIYPAPASKQLSCRYKKPTGKGAQELGGKPNQKCAFVTTTSPSLSSVHSQIEVTEPPRLFTHSFNTTKGRHFLYTLLF
jgi:hypothetical protein